MLVRLSLRGKRLVLCCQWYCLLILSERAFDLAETLNPLLSPSEQAHKLFIVLILLKEALCMLKPVVRLLSWHAVSMCFQVLVGLRDRVGLLPQVFKEDLMMRRLMIVDPLYDLAPTVPLMFAGRGKVNGIGL